MDPERFADAELPTLPSPVVALIEALEHAGHPSFAVGGCVRDRLMGRVPHDYDICTAATPEQMRASLSGVRLLSTGEVHGTLTALVDGQPYELTTFRVDGAYSDHRRPDAVRYVRELREDLARRDFTINAMADHPRLGLQDPFGGRDDIARRLVRCVGDPSLRFGEDALRILRALRFAATCGFDVEPATASAALALCHTLRYVARERILVEMSKLLCAAPLDAATPARGMRGFAPVLCAAMPGLAPLSIDEAAWERTIARVCSAPPSLAARWAALLWDLPGSAEHCTAVLRDLRCDNATAAQVEALLSARELPLSTDRAKLLHLLRLLGPDAARQLIALRLFDAPNAAQKSLAALDAFLQAKPCYRLSDLAVSGADLLALGLEGPQIGRTLQAMLDAVIEGRVENRRDALLEQARH